MRFDVLITGVGGQGVILASDIVAESSLRRGLYVRKSETHGMAQRGASVVSHIRIGGEGVGPEIPKGEADLLIGFEPMEALRYMEYVSPEGEVLVNKNPVRTGDYPDVEKIYRELVENQDAVLIDALSLAQETGYPMAQNTAMLGAAARYLPLEIEILRKTVGEMVPSRKKENLKAFELGIRYGRD